eukprot:TRINITY_DN740_c0_g1_i10.p1 TRINITY_DN740_c0_g1~~TRINITY_DN740_c0_g1_i10.p1  ORF type:complete len:255 (-),score=49.96 TRINITY_DN740_c0_g1_i10:107-871(-)
MKSLIFSLLLLSVFAANLTFYHYRYGSVSKDFEPYQLVSGPLFLEKEGSGYIVVLAGTYRQNYTNASFAVLSFANRTYVDNYTAKYVAHCVRGSWAHKEERLTGYINITQRDNIIYYNGTCFGRNSSYGANVTAVQHRSPFYTPNESAQRAHELVSMGAHRYRPVHVVNHAVLGYAYFPKVTSCFWYLYSFNTTFDFKPGIIIVGKDKKHCGILSNRGRRFIHADPRRGRVIESSLAVARQYFKKGFVLKDHSP